MCLDADFENKIALFKDSFDSLPVKTVTPKIHAILYHVPEFCSEHQKALGFFSEQASESVHSKFNDVWQKYKVAKDHPQYNMQLFKAVTEFNSYRI